MDTNESDEEVCGETFDHDTVVTSSTADGVNWYCRRCGAEGFDAAEDLRSGLED